MKDSCQTVKHSYLKLTPVQAWPILGLMLADGLILVDSGPYARYFASLALLLFLPGWVWLPIFFENPPLQPNPWPFIERIERLTLAVGLSLALTILSAMLVVYLPGPFNLFQLLSLLNLVIITGLAINWRQNWRTAKNLGQTPAPVVRLFPRFFNSGFLPLLLLVTLAALLRLPRLGYAEFHEDEAEALMLGVRLMQGEDYALFLHRKGPAQMLLPLAGWLLTGHITETMARFPFALSSILSVVALFLIGQRWFNTAAGLVAGLLWAVNGYAIAFGRMVQYQALIFFLGPLALYCLYLAWQYYQPRFQILGAVLLAACLLAHFDALLLLPAAGYLGWLNLGRATVGTPERQHHPQKRGGTPSKSSVTAIALAIFVALLASFYVPYMLDPEFANTAAYLAGSRIKPGLLYNNLNLLGRLDQDYSSRFYLPVLALGLISFVVWQMKRQEAGEQRRRPELAPIRRPARFSYAWFAWAILAGLMLLSASTFWFGAGWQIAQLNLAILPWLLLALIYFWRLPTPGGKTAWLMLVAPFIGYVFLVDDPRTHLYMIYPGAALVAGVGWTTVSERSSGLSISRLIALLIGGSLALVPSAGYEVAIFLSTESTLTRLQDHWDDSGWALVYDELPNPRDYFGYPKREGWKAIGALRAQGLFPGDFRSMNEDFIIPIWYNYGQARSCYDTPAHFFVRFAAELPSDQIPAQYTRAGEIQREQEVRLHLLSAPSFSANPEVVEQIAARPIPETYHLETLANAFDRLATPERFTQQSQPTQPVGTQFGPAILFMGYDLPTPTVAAGKTLYLNLYWQALQPPEVDYRAFVHLTGGTTLWGQQDDNPVCRLPASIWRPGQRGVGQFRLSLKPETPPGRYPLIIGLYQAETLERLKITGGAGQTGDDFLWLADIEVVKPAGE